MLARAIKISPLGALACTARAVAVLAVPPKAERARRHGSGIGGEGRAELILEGSYRQPDRAALGEAAEELGLRAAKVWNP